MKKLIFLILSSVSFYSYAQNQSNRDCLASEKEVVISLHPNYLSDSTTVGLYNEIVNSTQQEEKFTKTYSIGDKIKGLQISFKQSEVRFADAEESSLQQELLKSDCPVIKLGEGVLLTQNNLTEKDTDNIDLLMELLSHTTRITHQKEDLLAVHYFLVTPFSISGASGGYFVIPMEKATNENIGKKPIECGTGRIMQLENERNQKIIEDFIAASEKDTMFGNGLWTTIGKQNTDEEILKAGLKNYNLDWSISDLVKSVEKGNYKYLLLFHPNKNGAPLKMIALYDQNHFMFRTYDPFYYKNVAFPEIIGKWIMSDAFSQKEKPEITLKSVENELDYDYFLEIKEDYTFVMYDKGDCPAYVKINGRYSFEAERKITFYCNDIKYLGKKKKSKPFNETYSFEVKDGILILNK